MSYYLTTNELEQPMMTVHGINGFQFEHEQDLDSVLAQPDDPMFQVPGFANLNQQHGVVYPWTSFPMPSLPETMTLQQTIDEILSSIDLDEAQPVETEDNPVETITVELTSAKKVADEDIKRPPNAWILFRKDQHVFVSHFAPGLSNSDKSKIIARLWAGAHENTKRYYQDMARAISDAHKLMYPDWKYAPRKPGQRARRAARGPSSILNETEVKAIAETVAGTRLN